MFLNRLLDHLDPTSVAAWTKRYYLASRASAERLLRPYNLDSTQWYIMFHLANHGPTAQGELLAVLRVEKATLSTLVGTLVRKGLVDQTPDPANQRRRVLTLTDAGRERWRELPDPIALTLKVSFDGIDTEAMATAARVLRTATERLTQRATEGVGR